MLDLSNPLRLGTALNIDVVAGEADGKINDAAVALRLHLLANLVIDNDGEAVVIR